MVGFYMDEGITKAEAQKLNFTESTIMDCPKETFTDIKRMKIPIKFFFFKKCIEFCFIICLY